MLRELEAHWVGDWDSTDIVRYYRDRRYGPKDRRQTGYFGTWLGRASDDSPLLLRDTGTQEIYALDWQAP